MMWDDEEDYRTPRYLLWACIGLGSIMAVMGAGGIITALTTPDTSAFTVAGLILLVVLAFPLISTGARLLRDTPDGPDKD